MNEVAEWVRAARAEVDAAMGAFRRSWARAIGALAERIEAGSDLPDAASLEGLYEASLPTLTVVEHVLEELRARLATATGGRGEEGLRVRLASVGTYTSGWIEGGGVALTLLRDLPEPMTAAALEPVLSERLAFVEQRTTDTVNGWLTEIEASELATPAAVPAREVFPPGVTPAGVSPPGVTPAGVTPDTGAPADAALRQDRLSELLARASALGVRVRNPPGVPSEGYLRKLDAQLDDVGRKRAEQQKEAPERARRLSALLILADRVKVRVKEIPADPSRAWLDRMEAKLHEVAARKGVSFEGQRPQPARVAATQPWMDEPWGDREGAVTSEEPRPPLQVGPRARLAALVERAESAGFDLGRIPADPSLAWLDDTEGRLDAAIAQRREDKHAERARKEAERKSRISRIVLRAAEMGVDLGPIPPFPTDDWIERVEQRLSTSLLVTPSYVSERGTQIEEAPEDELPAEDEAPPEPHQAFLVFEEGTVQERLWPIEDDAVTLGRGRGNVVQIRDDAGVSRRHATLQRENGTFVLRDEGSTKGTLVDGEPVNETTLAGGERIRLGDTEFVFRLR